MNNPTHIERALEQSTMVKGLIRMTDKAIFQGIDSESIDWLVTQDLNKNYEVNEELDNAIKALHDTIRATSKAQEDLHNLMLKRAEVAQ